MAKVYKFRRFRNHEDFNRVRQIVVDKQLYCSDWRCLNDYLEGCYRIIGGNCLPLIELIRNSKEHWRVCSLSRDLLSSLMWAHYADGFSGVAIEFEVIAPHSCFCKVEYDDSFLRINNSVSAHELCEDIAKQILLHKSKCWERECETRLLSHTEKYDFSGDLKLTAIYYGPLMTCDCLAALKNIAREANNVDVVALEDKAPDQFGGFYSFKSKTEESKK